MARLRFPDSASIDRVQATVDTPLLSASGLAARVYVDDAGLTLADIQNGDGSANPTATLILDSLSRLPEFLGPTSGTDILYVRVDGGAPLMVEAILSQRFAAQDAANTIAVAAQLSGKTDKSQTYAGAPIDLTKVQSSVSARGASGLTVGEGLYGGVQDPLMQFGYNQTGIGGRRKSTEAAVFFGVEGYYNDGSPNPKQEAYLQYAGIDGTFQRPLMTQYDTVSSEITAMQLMGASGKLKTQGASLVEFMAGPTGGTAVPYAQLSVQRLNLLALDTTKPTDVNLAAAAGQPLLIHMGHDGDNDAWIFQTDVGAVRLTPSGAPTGGGLVLYSAAGGVPGLNSASIGVNENAAGLTVRTPYTGFPTFAARSLAGQTAALFEGGASGSPSFQVSATGGLYFTPASLAAFREIQVGAADSAGAGYRTLRVAN